MKSDGSGEVADTDVQFLDTGQIITFGVPVVRNDPNELRFKPAGFNNDFIIDEPNRGSNAYTVVFLQGASLAADWQQAGNVLTVTVAPTQTALELITAINAAVTAGSGARVSAGLLHDGENSDPDDPNNDLLEPHEYEPLGGMPFNNRGVGAGSCNYCHNDDGKLDVNGDPAPESILNNHDTHHGIDLPSGNSGVSDGMGGKWNKCNMCHDYSDRDPHLDPDRPDDATYSDVGGPGFALAIRICEECHSLESLHNIQADSDLTPGEIVVGGEELGYGHVGRDGGPGDSDCWGCHGFDFNASSTSLTGALIPTLYSTDVASLSAGKAATILVSGAALTNTANGTSYESTVKLTAADGAFVTLEPDVILDQGSLAVTIPAGTLPGNYKVQAAKGDVDSNPTVISITPAVTITRAIVRGTSVIITGSGFSGYAAGSGTSVTGRVNRQTVEGNIISWNDRRIVASLGSIPPTVTVNSVFGNATVRVSTQKAAR